MENKHVWRVFCTGCTERRRFYEITKQAIDMLEDIPKLRPLARDIIVRKYGDRVTAKALCSFVDCEGNVLPLDAL